MTETKNRTELIELIESYGGKLLEVHLTGKLKKEDYEAFVPELERAIERQNKVRLLVVLTDFHGWTGGALWEDLKFDAKHFDDIERVAICGEKKWEEGMAVICKPFTAGTVKFFEIEDLAQAREWIQEDLAGQA